MSDPNQHTLHLLQVIADTLAQPQPRLNEQRIVSIPIFTNENQNLLGWLNLISKAFEINNILETRRLAVLGAYLIELATFFLYSNVDKPMEYQITYQETSQRVMKVQIFVQGLHSDLLLAVKHFISSALQEAIKKAQICEMTIAREPSSVILFLPLPK
ncbi:21184_t:CDS:2 [Dentiscutata erythropus]|uniref:21184_t:CDS:1 n=1 Tax=Dentiscutata erythropus TaxID=1348616 RepID=A0A9N9HNM9_9GLOM|nr:21184_t:CDS:2 [Dentiscutata erythropus]